MNCYNIDIQWLNTLGGWEHWRFTAFKTYGYAITNSETVQRDINQNWDTDFISGTTETENISINANETIAVRSQDLTLQQINAISKIKFSIKVNDETGDLVTIVVDKANIQYRTDNDKRFTISFDIAYPGIIIQTGS